jgi:hypothetical protein
LIPKDDDMAKDGRHSVRLGQLKPYLEKLAARKKRSVSQLIYIELEKLVRRSFPEFEPEPEAEAELAHTN